MFHCLVITPTVVAEQVNPTDQLRPFIDQVVLILTDDELQDEPKIQERRRRVMDVVHEHFDFFEMSKRVYGQQWTTLSKGQQGHFVDLFSKLLEHAYIGKIESYSKQTVTFEKERRKGDLAEVQTILIDNNVSLPISYLMILKNNRWMVFDVAVDKVSIARNYRDQFRQVLQTGHYDGLINQLKEKLKILEGK
jgi:phospholipid transport system substrate-binding protein